MSPATRKDDPKPWDIPIDSYRGPCPAELPASHQTQSPCPMLILSAGQERWTCTTGVCMYRSVCLSVCVAFQCANVWMTGRVGAGLEAPSLSADLHLVHTSTEKRW